MNRESVRGYKSAPVEKEKLDYILAAAEQGLGSCWICNFDVDKASGLFDLSDNLEPAVLIPIGYSATESIREKSRKDLSEIVETR